MESIIYTRKRCTRLAEDSSVVSDKYVITKVAEIDTDLTFVQNKYKKCFLRLNTPKNKNYRQNTVVVKYI